MLYGIENGNTHNNNITPSNFNTAFLLRVYPTISSQTSYASERNKINPIATIDAATQIETKLVIINIISIYLSFRNIVRNTAFLTILMLLVL